MYTGNVCMYPFLGYTKLKSWVGQMMSSISSRGKDNKLVPEAGTSRSTNWHRLLQASRNNNCMDKAARQKFPSIGEKKEGRCCHSFLFSLCHPREKSSRLTCPKPESLFFYGTGLTNWSPVLWLFFQ